MKQSTKLIPVILSGGSGTRLWPLSRENHPKQFLPVTGEKTLLQQTVLRLSGIGFHTNDIPPPIVVCNEEHRFLVAEQLREVDVAASNIILEPVGRNTAPALTIAALHIADPDAVMLVMPADHDIKNVSAFHNAVAEGIKQTEQGYMVTFGIVPISPETGYGYIKSGDKLEDSTGMKLVAFVEKPSREKAEEYLAQRGYFWNSGMFMMKASTWLEAIGKYRPEILDSCQLACEQAVKDTDFMRLDADKFSSCPSDSIDYAVMEKVVSGVEEIRHSAVVIPLDAGWSDVGSWPALWEIQDKDKAGNVTQGDVLLQDTKNSLLISNDRLVAAVGVEDIVLVETADAILVAHKNSAQDVKLIANTLKANGRDEHAIHRCTHRPWGSYEGIDFGSRFQVKRITVKPGASLSLQMHYHRAEHWVVVSGTAKVTRGNEEIILAENQSTYIPLGVVHRLENPGSIPLEMIEVQSGSYLGEDDIVRLDDVYGREIMHEK